MSSKPPKSYHVKSFGCQMNVYDGERMSELLGAEGMVAAEADSADLVVLNTCHIREKAAEKVYSDIGRLVLRPGWRWSVDVKPIAGTDLCEAPHFQYHVAGVLRIAMADGTTFDAGPGDVTSLPSGHDAWVVGDEPVVVVDWYGASGYAK